MQKLDKMILQEQHDDNHSKVALESQREELTAEDIGKLHFDFKHSWLVSIDEDLV